jgi:osmoprotectant transport system permease protein
MTSPLTIAAAGEVGSGFFRERSSDTLPCQATDKLFCFDWAREHIDRYGAPTVQHLKLVALSVLFGFAIAFFMALLAHRRRWLQPPFLAGTGALYAIPSVAFFFLLLPFTGRGVDTAIIALTAYTLQIIYRNTIAGLANVSASVKDAARGMGLSAGQVLWRVELPLAAPEIFAGLRIATVSTVAIATLATLAGGGGLGAPIFSQGISFKTNIIIAGGIAMAMALAFDAVFYAVQRLLTPWRRAERA